MPRSKLEALVDRYCAAALSQEESNIIAVSGAPNSGKSTLVELLRQRGMLAILEVATKLIETHGPEIRSDSTAFQRAVFEGQFKAEIPVRRSGRVAVGERGLYDSVGYFRVRGVELPGMYRIHLNRIAAVRRQKPLYRAVFMLETVAQWDDNGIRDEDVDFSRRLFDHMSETYGDYGEDVVRVPIFSSDREESNEKRGAFVIGEMAKRRLLI
jgi:predicted ATPase